MPRLQSELQRLYAAPTAQSAGQGLAAHGAPVRVVVLSLASPADWTLIARVWRGVQADLDLPAPAIAVSGVDGYQLYFSLAEPLAQPQALGFAQALQGRYLSDVAQDRVGIATPAFSNLPPRPTDEQEDHWSAFVAPDLAPVFTAEPWLDIPPSREGQADLLCRLQSIQTKDLATALAKLGVARLTPISPVTPMAASAASNDAANMAPERFLAQVMNDTSVAMALRIEAAKALLQAKK
ncbi:hypothetical protein LNV08_06380 [Paucibacter sp. TC2R-5]|uniref:hypothetical protein n=1 Tax=Paucibacter sp. TC2R-5 TaxID=2893555 RepID=UPI0021E5113D|nr:hypothetical protein [Paucibacter sp. TC2R-5]MCV2358601.1 hypothetical protein [Paucibacter sp. TC2R-5]